MEILLTYGLLNGKITHILKVENGLKCNCVCPNCNHPLVARNNPANKKQPHFAHYSGRECDGAYESALHLLAKDVFLKTKELQLPDYHHNNNPKLKVFKSLGVIRFDKVILERSVNIGDQTITPDAIAIKNNTKIYIEFANSHFVDQNKLNKLKTSDIACVEIDLCDQVLDEAILQEFYNSKSHDIYWLYNPKLDKEYKEYKKQKKLEKKAQELANKKRLEAELEKDCIEKSHKRLEVMEKVKYYSNNSFNVFEFRLNSIRSICPIIIEIKKLTKFKNTNLYKHPVLKKIIDGEKWNGEIYGKSIYWGKYTYINNEKIVIFPPERDYVGMSDQENKSRKFLYWALNKLSEELYDPELGKCESCKFCHDKLEFEEHKYIVCKHPNVFI